MRHGWLVLVAVLVLAAPAQAQVEAGSKTLAEGQVSATLTWQKGEVFAEQPSLQITRGGAVAFDGKLEDQCKICSELGDADSALQVRDLDGDGDPEVLVDTYTGGAHCCTVTPIFHWVGNGYRKVTGFFGNVGYSLDDLDHDGRPEFVTADDSLAYEFTAYAFSAFPLLILEYGIDRSGHAGLRDVTSGYPSMVAKEAAGFRKDIPKYHADKDGDARGVIAAYTADLYRLGRKKQANDYLNSLLRRGWLKSPDPGFDIWPSGRKYLRELKRFLKKHHYG